MATEETSILHHYTSIQGLLGIADSKAIWATHIQHLNDMHEVRDASLVAQAIVTSHFEKRGSSEFRRMLLDMIIKFNGANTVVASFSENGDLLSQWRSYCPEGGVSIGFDRTELEGLLAKNQGFRLEKCIYRRSEKEEILHAILESAFQRCEELGEPYNYNKQCDIFAGFYPRFLAASVTMKNESFSEEREWRLIGGPFNFDDPRAVWRAGKDSAIPSFRFSLGDPPPVVSVCQGPSRDPHYALGALMTFIRSRNWRSHDDIKISKTSSTFRRM